MTRLASIAFKREGDTILLIGKTEGHLGQSLYLREIEGRRKEPRLLSTSPGKDAIAISSVN